MLDTHRLKIFRSVIVHGSVQAAATSLGHTPSAVSQHLSALQRETGLALFERVGRGLQATPAGLRLAEEAEAVLRRIGEAEHVVERLRTQHQSALSIAYFASAGVAWLPPLLVRLEQKFSDVEVSLVDADEPPERAEDAADLQLVVGPPGFAPRPGTTAIHLLTEPFAAVVPIGHPLARQVVRASGRARDGGVDRQRHGSRRLSADAPRRVRERRILSAFPDRDR